MQNRICSECYYGGICGNDEVCDDYTPFNDSVIEREIDKMIELNRIAFRMEWFEYIDNWI